MKGLAALAFFFVFTVLIGAGLVIGVSGHWGGWLLMIVALLAYLVAFVIWGCRTSSH